MFAESYINFLDWGLFQLSRPRPLTDFIRYYEEVYVEFENFFLYKENVNVIFFLLRK